MWKYQHNLQHWRHNASKTALPLDTRDTRRLECEFEAALEQRGSKSTRALLATTEQGDECAA